MVEVLNMHRPHKRSLRLCPDGQINFRMRVVRLLDLHVGDRVIFCLSDGQMYLYKDNTDSRALTLRGRKNQLSAQSVDTVKSVLASVSGLTSELRKQPVELVVFNRTMSIIVDGVSHTAVNIINRL